MQLLKYRTYTELTISNGELTLFLLLLLLLLSDEGGLEGWIGRLEGWKVGRLEGRMDGWPIYNTNSWLASWLVAARPPTTATLIFVLTMLSLLRLLQLLQLLPCRCWYSSGSGGASGDWHFGSICFLGAVVLGSSLFFS